MSIAVGVVEDDKEVRNALIRLIENTSELEYVASFSSAEKFIINFDTLEMDVVLMDIHLPGNSGIDTVKKLKPKRIAVQYLMFTVFEDEDKIFDSLCAGATGYLLKNTPAPKIIDAIKEIHSGGSPMSAQIARKVIKSFTPKPENNSLLDIFTAREAEILEHLSKGYRYKEIGGILYKHRNSTTHIRNIYQKLEVQSRTEALNKVYQKR